MANPENAVIWRKSTFSDNNDCVEVVLVDGPIIIRDSKNQAGTKADLLVLDPRDLGLRALQPVYDPLEALLIDDLPTSAGGRFCKCGSATCR
jgi:hypothetical protein